MTCYSTTDDTCISLSWEPTMLEIFIFSQFAMKKEEDLCMKMNKQINEGEEAIVEKQS